MFNPLYPFTKDLLKAFVKSGKIYFVRNKYSAAFDHFDGGAKNFLITHYDDISKAKAHFNSIAFDPHRFMYHWKISEHKEKLLIAASQPQGYKIYSSLFLPNWEKKITINTKEKINRYMYAHTNWKPGSGEKTHLNFYFQFGQLYFTLSYNGNKITGKFEEIEN